MHAQNVNKKSWQLILRWSARVIGTLIVLTSVIFLLLTLLSTKRL